MLKRTRQLWEKQKRLVGDLRGCRPTVAKFFADEGGVTDLLVEHGADPDFHAVWFIPANYTDDLETYLVPKRDAEVTIDPRIENGTQTCGTCQAAIRARLFSLCPNPRETCRNERNPAGLPHTTGRARPPHLAEESCGSYFDDRPIFESSAGDSLRRVRCRLDFVDLLCVVPIGSRGRCFASATRPWRLVVRPERCHGEGSHRLADPSRPAGQNACVGSDQRAPG